MRDMWRSRLHFSERRALLVRLALLIALVVLLTSALLIAHALSVRPAASRPIIPRAPLSMYLLSTDLRAFDASDGHVRWSYQGKNVLGAPVLANNILYLGSRDGRAIALKASDGSILWTYQGPGTPTSFAQIEQVAGGVVYVDYSTAGAPSQELYALDALTGALLWRFGEGALVSGVVNNIVYVYSYPVRSETPAVKIYALNASDGSVRWQFQTPEGQEYILRVADGLVYVAGYSGPNQYGGSSLYALNASDGALRWTYTQGNAAGIGNVQVEHGLVYVTWGKGGSIFLTALSETNGTTRWQQMLGQAGNTFVPLFVSNGVIYALEGLAGLAAFNEADGKLLWHALQGQVRLFAIADGVIYLSVTTYSVNVPSVMMALNASDGSIKWRSAHDAISGTLNGGVLYCILYPYAQTGDSNPNLHSLIFALNASDGAVRWSEETIQYSWSPAVG